MSWWGCCSRCSAWLVLLEKLSRETPSNTHVHRGDCGWCCMRCTKAYTWVVVIMVWTHVTLVNMKTWSTVWTLELCSIFCVVLFTALGKWNQFEKSVLLKTKHIHVRSGVKLGLGVFSLGMWLIPVLSHSIGVFLLAIKSYRLLAFHKNKVLSPLFQVTVVSP